jgi:nicotinamide-nucleotide amidase
MTKPDPIAQAVVLALVNSGQHLATVESLTGGLIGATLTSVPGASQAYLGGLITYATELKHRLALVPSELLAEVGPISGRTAAAMALGAQSVTGADWALAVTGAAGPDPQDGHAPGEVWVGLGTPAGEPVIQRLQLGGSREQIRAQTVAAALAMLLAALNSTAA